MDPTPGELTPQQMQHRTVEAIEHTAKSFAAFYALARFAPHPALRAFGQFMVGMHPRGYGAGRALNPRSLVPSGPRDFALNFAPVPVGFVDPTVVGLPRDVLFPPRSSVIIPQFVDPLGLGTKEARESDAARAQYLATQSQLTAARIVVDEPNDVLQQIVAGGGPLTRTNRLLAYYPYLQLIDLQNAAGIEFNRRQFVSLSGPTEPSRAAALLAPGAAPQRAAVIAPAAPPNPAIVFVLYALQQLQQFAADNPPDP